MEMAVQVRPRPSVTPWPSSLPFSASLKIRADATGGTTRASRRRSIQAAFSPSVSFRRTADEQSSSKGEPSSLGDGTRGGGNAKMKASKKRVFFLDVNPLCYEGSAPSLRSFARWISLFFSQVSRDDPVVAVLDGERGSEHRRRLLPSYKAQRRKFSRQHGSPLLRSSRSSVDRSHRFVVNFLKECNVPVIKVEDHEADDVVATLVEQALQKGYRVVIASPDKDFKQLISEYVQIVMPVDELQRWSFYTLKHYVEQYNCDPDSDLSLRCILGDDVDGVPGIQHLVPAFGRKTAVKLLKKHGSLENLLNAAAVRTVGKEYAQEALTKYANYLRRNYEVLALRRDVNVFLQEEWLVERNSAGDSRNLSTFLTLLEEAKLHHHNRHHPPKNLASEDTAC
ncbi:uncharacterized protein LOC115681596 isoform X2 [Syzygium oleosum]|uniref:uncharacterized protein LOC115681596 isoform X2 n=1 Tax=Syzygium oleosum TaxID=219896 RepID=UPI0011D2276F|nr:uncharacterized protein LOC115681596 isoform X2 [Syzygium oleosum]